MSTEMPSTALTYPTVRVNIPRRMGNQTLRSFMLINVGELLFVICGYGITMAEEMKNLSEKTTISEQYGAFEQNA
jgi:hypothetical protein